MMPLVRGYRDRFEAATGSPWMSLDANRRQIVAVARWLDVSGTDIARWLDAWFGDEWAKAHRWPWKHAAKDPSKFLGPAEEAARDRDRQRALSRRAALEDEYAHASKLASAGNERAQDRAIDIRRELEEGTWKG